jgi:Tfp pilus assembly protein PilF
VTRGLQARASLAITEAILGPDHSSMARWHTNLGSVLWQLSDPAGARTQYKRALTIDEVVLGADHPRVATNRNNVDRIVQELGDQSANA